MPGNVGGPSTCQWTPTIASTPGSGVARGLNCGTCPPEGVSEIDADPVFFSVKGIGQLGPTLATFPR